MKKSIIVVLSLCLLLVGCLMVACNKEVKTYKVKLSYDNALGSVTLSEPSDGKAYKENESVTVTVVPNGGYEVNAFTVSGIENAALTDGKFTFTIKADTTVTVEFKKTAEEIKTYNVELSYDNTLGSVTLSEPSDGKAYKENESVTVTVAPNVGCEVSAFTVSGIENAALTDGSFTFTIKADTTVTVGFAKLTFAAKITKNTADKGTVTITPEKEKYEYGEQVTVSVTCEQGYVAQIKFNGAIVAPDQDGKYTFTVTEAFELEIGVVERAQGILESLQGSLVIEGTRLEKDYLHEVETKSDLKTTFDGKNKAVLIEAYEGGEPIRVWLFKEAEGGSTVQLHHDMSGKLSSQPHDFPFEQLFNPFDLIEKEDLTLTENGKWTIEDAEKLEAICNAILGYADVVEKFELIEQNGVIVGLDLAFERSADEYGFSDYQYTYDLTFSRKGTEIDADYFTNYTLSNSQIALKNTMQKAAKATSYTVSYKSEELEYNIYYTPDGIYIDEKGEERGYFVRSDNNVWSGFYDPEAKAFEFDGIVKSGSDLSFLKAVFTLSDNNGEYYMLLKDLGDGVFAARAIDVYDSYCNLTSFFGQQVATGMEQIEDLSGAVSFKLALSGDVLKSVELDTDMGHVTLTFDKWDETTLPVELSESDKNGKIDASYSGNWSTEQGDKTINIDLDKISIDDEYAQDIVAVADGGYSFKIGEDDYTVKLADGKLTLKKGEKTATLVKCDWAMYIGTFLGVEGDGTYIDIIITASEIEIKRGDASQKATDIKFETVQVVDDYGYVENAYQFTFKVGGKEYILQQYGYTYDLVVYAPAGEQNGVGLHRDKYVELEDWTEYVGSYKGEGYELKIESDKFTITHDSQSEVISEIKFYSDFDYDNNQEYKQFAFTYGGKNCIVEIIDNAMLLVIDADKQTGQSFYLMDEKYTFDYEFCYGTYEGDEFDEEYNPKNHYTVVFGEKTTIKVGDETQEATVIYYSEVEAYGGNKGGYFVVKTEDGTIYTLTIYPSLRSVTMMKGNTYIYLSLVPEE